LISSKDLGLGLGIESFTLKHTNSKKIKLFIVCQGPDFHETLPLFGTYEIGPWAWDQVFHTKAHKLKKNKICLLYAKGPISMRLSLFLVLMKSGLET